MRASDVHNVAAIHLLLDLAENADLERLDNVGPMTAEAIRESLLLAVEALRRT